LDYILSEIFTVEHLTALVALTALEIVLGIDNIVFIAIVSDRLPEHQAPRARKLGLLAAMAMRVVLLLGVVWIMKLQATLFTVPITGWEISGKDLILVAGGLFLVAKATHEIHGMMELHEEAGERAAKGTKAATFSGVIIQIMLLDAVFSIDSVITAVGMADALWVMITAVVIAIGVMLIFADPIANFVRRHPSIKMLALSFLVLIGVMLMVESVDIHIPRGYVYFAMAFALAVDLLQMRIKKKPSTT